jgi:ketosteroid isomerase-like protein
MKRTSAVFSILILGLAVWFFLPTKSIAAPDNEQTIVRLERAWVAAIVAKDFAALERLIAPEFSGTSPNAHFYNREMAIDDLKSGRYVVEKMELDEVSANIYGNTAVAFTSQKEISRYGDSEFSGHYHYTNVWVKKNGRWLVVASHGSRFDKPHEETKEVPWGEGQFDLLPH